MLGGWVSISPVNFIRSGDDQMPVKIGQDMSEFGFTVNCDVLLIDVGRVLFHPAAIPMDGDDCVHSIADQIPDHFHDCWPGIFDFAGRLVREGAGPDHWNTNDE